MSTTHIENALQKGATLTAHAEAGRIRARLRWPTEYAVQGAAFATLEEALGDLDEKAAEDDAQVPY